MCGACAEARLPKCAACRLPLKGKYMTANDQMYHAECFTCKKCTKRIQGGYFPQPSGGFWCSDCFEASQPKEFCAGCRQEIKGEYLTDSKKQKFHPRCFNCSKCRMQINGPYVDSDQGRLCPDCQPKCPVCKLPFGNQEVVTLGGDKKIRLHAKCFSCSHCKKVIEGRYFSEDRSYVCETCHVNILQMKEDRKERSSRQEEYAIKRKNTDKFTLYWRPELKPENQKFLASLGVQASDLLRSPYVSLCFNPRTCAVTCAQTQRAETSTNLSYLACALKVLTTNGRAPQFSLDPENAHDMQSDNQIKAFYPQWLAGTVFGEILFQADYALKELCFGDKALPGLPSLFDEAPTATEAQAARQWFVVRKAWVDQSSDGALVPQVKMGVEARRLVMGPKGYQDADVTDPNDPAVRHAQAFSERIPEACKLMPVINELIEIAKASVLARYLLEKGAKLNHAALESYSIPDCPEGPLYTLVIPTLSKRRTSSQVITEGDGVLVRSLRQTMHGGVDLALKEKKVADRPLPAAVLAPKARPVRFPLFAAASAA